MIIAFALAIATLPRVDACDRFAQRDTSPIQRLTLQHDEKVELRAIEALSNGDCSAAFHALRQLGADIVDWGRDPYIPATEALTRGEYRKASSILFDTVPVWIGDRGASRTLRALLRSLQFAEAGAFDMADTYASSYDIGGENFDRLRDAATVPFFRGIFACGDGRTDRARRELLETIRRDVDPSDPIVRGVSFYPSRDACAAARLLTWQNMGLAGFACPPTSGRVTKHS